MAQWPETRRLGLLKAATDRMALHPPHTLERTELDLNDLLDGQGDGPLPAEPSLLHWTTD
jgi:hypothetical protein